MSVSCSNNTCGADRPSVSRINRSVNSADSVLSVGARRKKYLKFRSVRAAELEQPHMKIFFMRSATALAGLVEELL